MVQLTSSPFFLKKKSGPQTIYTPTTTAPKQAAAVAIVEVLTALEKSMLKVQKILHVLPCGGILFEAHLF